MVVKQLEDSESNDKRATSPANHILLDLKTLILFREVQKFWAWQTEHFVKWNRLSPRPLNSSNAQSTAVVPTLIAVSLVICQFAESLSR
jgi:hypothetical protein